MNSKESNQALLQVVLSATSRLSRIKRYLMHNSSFQNTQKLVIPVFSNNPNDNLDIFFNTTSCANHDNRKNKHRYVKLSIVRAFESTRNTVVL